MGAMVRALKLVLGAAVMALMGCGAMAIEEPGEGSLGAEDRPVSTDELDEADDVADVTESEPDPEPEPVVSEDCQKLCFQAQWCDDRGEALESCMVACKGGEDDQAFGGLISAATMACFDDALTCTGMGRCKEEIALCDEACQQVGGDETCRARCGSTFLKGEGLDEIADCALEGRNCEILQGMDEQVEGG